MFKFPRNTWLYIMNSCLNDLIDDCCVYFDLLILLNFIALFFCYYLALMQLYDYFIYISISIKEPDFFSSERVVLFLFLLQLILALYSKNFREIRQILTAFGGNIVSFFLGGLNTFSPKALRVQRCCQTYRLQLLCSFECPYSR